MREGREKLQGVGHNYVLWGNVGETIRSTRIAIQNTGQDQAIHLHGVDEECNEKCYVMTEKDLEGEG